MALHELHVKDCIIDVAVNQSSTKIAILTKKEIQVFAINLKSRPIKAPHLEWQHNFIQSSRLPRQIAFKGDSTVYILMDDSSENQCFFGKSTAEEINYHRTMQSTSVTSILTSRDFNSLSVQYSDGVVCNESPGGSNEDILLDFITKFPRPMVHFAVSQLGKKVSHNIINLSQLTLYRMLLLVLQVTVSYMPVTRSSCVVARRS